MDGLEHELVSFVVTGNATADLLSLAPRMEPVSIDRVAPPSDPPVRLPRRRRSERTRAPHFRGRRPAPRRTVWPCGVVGLPPALDQGLGPQQCAKHRSAQEFIPRLDVEALHAAVPPRGPQLDGERLHPDPFGPLPHMLQGELTALWRTRRTMKPGLSTTDFSLTAVISRGTGQSDLKCFRSIAKRLDSHTELLGQSECNVANVFPLGIHCLGRLECPST